MRMKVSNYIAKRLVEEGISDVFMITGGGAMLKGLDKLINQETGIDVYIAENPLDCVANGTGYVLDNMNVLGDVLQTDTRKF